MNNHIEKKDENRRITAKEPHRLIHPPNRKLRKRFTIITHNTTI